MSDADKSYLLAKFDYAMARQDSLVPWIYQPLPELLEIIEAYTAKKVAEKGYLIKDRVERELSEFISEVRGVQWDMMESPDGEARFEEGIIEDFISKLTTEY